ncbi:tRNA pseudouridine(38-40) synthase TruA [Longirhabdus pacifica]|uniref:tRNA pseudouridine(38-40) synthase TruA n=1 Tax=Longirhabdus pacifica TaxID=2305227 RepID=UPI001F0B7E66|nr:tRNA pseudouridine(38-40) synthase TruA [Longirhabdus pacifica]
MTKNCYRLAAYVCKLVAAVVMRNIKMVVSYDGTMYSGFQRQPQERTVQGEIETVLNKLTGRHIDIISAGRTDSGVHARGQVFNFFTHSSIKLSNWGRAMNALLPMDIRILEVDETPLTFHARKTAHRKTYCYTVNTGRVSDVFQHKFQHHYPRKLDVDKMKLALDVLIGKHDFTSFCSAKSTKSCHERTIYDIRIALEQTAFAEQGDTPLMRIWITGNGFLYNMVRIIVGTVLKIGEHKWDVSSMKNILEAKDRNLAGPTAPAKGLVLWDIKYD